MEPRKRPRRLALRRAHTGAHGTGARLCARAVCPPDPAGYIAPVGGCGMGCGASRARPGDRLAREQPQRVRAHAAAVRVRGDHRAEPETHHIPCRSLRQVRYIRQDPVGIQRAHKVAPLCREPLCGRVAVRACEGVCVVPCQRHIHALPRRGFIQPVRVAVEQLRPLDAEQRSRFPGCPCRAHVPRRAAAAHEIGIARTFALEQRVLLLRDGMERLACRGTVGKDREDLRVLPECRAAREVDVAGVLP